MFIATKLVPLQFLLIIHKYTGKSEEILKSKCFYEENFGSIPDMIFESV